MINAIRRATLVALLLVCAAPLTAVLPAQATTQPRPIPSIAERTTGMRAMPGFFNLYWDDATGKLFWEIDKLDTEFLYAISMASGIGSNPVGIDRGQLGGTSILIARKTGPRVLLMEPNYRFQARTTNRAEQQAVRDAFAPSIHWGFDVVAQTGSSVLVDATNFFMRDARGVIETIASRQEGRFVLDASRSALYPERIKSFPNNNEIEAVLTFTSAQPGRLINGVAASGEAVTVRQHHSLMKLPDGDYEPRFADPRIGVSGSNVMDFAQPIDQDVYLRFRRSSSPEKEGSFSCAFGAGESDHLLCGPWHPRTRAYRVGGRCKMVGSGV